MSLQLNQRQRRKGCALASTASAVKASAIRERVVKLVPRALMTVSILLSASAQTETATFKEQRVFQLFWGTPSLSLGRPWSTSLDVPTRQCTWFGPLILTVRGPQPTEVSGWHRFCALSITHHLPLRFPDTLAVMALDEREEVGYHRLGSGQGPALH